MIEWYNDNILKIEFNKIPCVGVRYALPTMTDVEKKSIAKYPFINKKELRVKITYYTEECVFIIPKDYCFDGASIPRLFWRVIGAKTDNTFLIAAMIHDWMCEHHNVVDNNRYLADKVFEKLLYLVGTNLFFPKVLLAILSYLYHAKVMLGQVFLLNLRHN